MERFWQVLLFGGGVSKPVNTLATKGTLPCEHMYWQER